MSDNGDGLLERSPDRAQFDGMAWASLLPAVPGLAEYSGPHDIPHASLVTEILNVLAGARVVVPADGEPPFQPLSDGETRVLRYLPTGLTAPEIANELYLSVNTVKTHLRHVYAKLGVHRRLAAVERARALGLLSGPRCNH